MHEFWIGVIENSIGEVIFFGLSILFGFLYLRAKNTLKKDSPLKKIGGGIITPSPDGLKVAIESEGDIWVSGRAGFTNLTNSPEKEFRPVWAPNGKWLAFNVLREGTWRTYVIDVETQKSVLLSKIHTVLAPIGWNDNNDLLIGMGGSIMLIKHTEIKKRLE